jgi:hypothetical protein
MPREQLLVQKASTLQQGYGSVEEFIAQFKKGSLQLQSGCNLEQTLESKVTGVLNGIRETAGKVRASIRLRCGRSQQMAVTRALVDGPCSMLCKPKYKVAPISTGSTPRLQEEAKKQCNLVEQLRADARQRRSLCMINNWDLLLEEEGLKHDVPIRSRAWFFIRWSCHNYVCSSCWML